VDETVLTVEDLAVEFRTDEGVVNAVDGVSYELARGEVLAVLGESGSGKTVHARAIMRILETPPAFITGGAARLRDVELLSLSEAEMREVRGSKIAMLFQDPHSALDPVYTVGKQFTELLQQRQKLSKRQAKARALGLLEQVGVPDPRKRLKSYPHELSGGTAQRVMVAMAIALEPDVLLADEPTSSLDVTVQAQVLELLASLVAETEMAMVLITHNLSVAVGLAQRIAVMYAGRIVELGPAQEVFAGPKHPYTAGLLRSIPDIQIREERLAGILGAPPNLLLRPSGCAFHPRCPLADDRCRTEVPPFEWVSPQRSSACFHPNEVVR
jgi:oligopeptide transport system ATP-binding protein